MKVSMILKLVAMSSAAVGTQAALLCTTDKFCATVDSAKPHCIYTSATASECKAALLATTTLCYVKSTKDLKQCADTDFCDFGHATDKKCKTKIVAGTTAANAAVGSTDAEKAHSCKSGEVGSDGKCTTASDAGCTAEAGSAKYYVSSSASAAACQAAASLLANGADCFKKSTKAAIQCVATDYCDYGHASLKKCKTKIATGTAAGNTAVGDTPEEKAHSCASGEVGSDGKCATVSDAGCAATNSATTFLVTASAGATAACAAGLAANANCFAISTDAANQCAAGQCFKTDGACKNPTNDADCKAAIASKPFYVKATATGAIACGAGLAKDAQCFIKTTATANQCADGHYCPATSDAATNKCAALVATGGDCTAGGAIACQSGICNTAKCMAIADAAACTKVTTATFNQCGANSYCPATSTSATNKCVAKLAKDGDCTTIGGVACKSNTCTSNKCVDSAAPTTTTTAPTTTTKAPSKAPSKAPTKADHSDASAITASSFVVAATVFASSMFA